MRHPLIAGLLLLLAACQPLPQPFAEDRPPPGAPILTPKDGAGIEVRPVAGTPDDAASGAFAEAMAEALRDADVPAFTQSANRAALHLSGTAEVAERPGGRAQVTLHWELRERDGSKAGADVESEEVGLAEWRQGNQALLQRLAKRAAPRIAALLQEDGIADAAAGEPRILVRPISGAPGDGSRALARAMVASLQHANLAVTDKEPAPELAAKLFVIAGNVTMASAGEGKQKVTVSWALFDPRGLQVGQISQSNAVPAGSLDARWGDTAYAVAGAAADGIVALLDQLRRTGS